MKTYIRLLNIKSLIRSSALNRNKINDNLRRFYAKQGLIGNKYLL